MPSAWSSSGSIDRASESLRLADAAPVRRALLIALLFAGSGCAGILDRDPDAAPPPTLTARFAAMPTDERVVTDIDWYQPTERVSGALRSVQRRDEIRRFERGATVERISRFASVARAADELDTLALVVLQDGVVAFERYAPGFGPESRFDTQSMHRALVALAVLAAHEDGLLPSLDVPVSNWIREWSVVGDPRALITVRDLLLGRSGLVDPPYSPTLDSPGLALFLGTDLRTLAITQRPDRHRSVASRGSAVEVQLMGLVLETIAGTSYAKFLSRRLWQPSGAADATVRLDRAGGSTRVFCCLQARARDWARIGELVRTEGRPTGEPVLTAETIAMLLAPNPLNRAQGMHWLLEPTTLIPRSQYGDVARPPPTAFASRGIVYAGGRGGQRVYVLPAERAVVVRIGRIRNDFDDGRFLNPIIAALTSTP